MGIINLYVSILKVKRATEITGVLIKYSFKEIFAHSRFHRRRRKVHKPVYTTPERMRMTIEELGPTFVKFGQILADRPDMVSEPLRMELKKLQSRAKPFDNEYAMALIEKELNTKIHDIFSEFDPTALAAASIGQVYQGKLLNGEEVIIKIQRPFIENKIKLDIYLMKFIARKVAMRYPEMAAINIVGLTDEFADTILDELNYANEASNILRFAQMFEEEPTVHIPKLYPQYSTKRLLVMEKIIGVTPDSKTALIDAGLDPDQIAINGANALLTMIIRHGFFHADPHPGNIFIMPNNVVAFVDFGMVGKLRPRDMNFLVDFALGFAKRDSDMISRSLLVLCNRKFFEEEEELKFEIHEMMMRYANVPLEMLHFSVIMQSCIDVIVKYKLQIPSGIFMLIKTLATLEKFSKALSPNMILSNVITPYAKEAVKNKYSPRKLAGEVFDTLTNYVSLIRELPKDLSEILYKLKEGKIKHEIQLEDTALFTRTMRQITRQISYIVLLVGVFIGSILMIVFEQPQGTSAYGHFLLIAASILILFQLIRWMFTNRKS